VLTRARRFRAPAAQSKGFIMRKICSVLFVTLSLFTTLAALSACNTTAGMGQDIQAGGKAITNSADKNGADPAR
jgi:predicted small secreted protein